MDFLDLRRKTLVTVDEGTSTARIESYNVHLLATLRRSSGREGIVCLADFPDFGVYMVPKDMVADIARQTYEDMLKELESGSPSMKKIEDYKIRLRKYGGNKCRK